MSAADASADPAGGNAGGALAHAKALIEAARFGEAEALLTAELAGPLAEPDEVEARYALAVARRYAGDAAGALEALETLVALRPEHGRAHQERGHAWLALGREDEARAAFARAAELNPGLVASLRALASLSARAGETEAARAAEAQLEYLNALPADLVGVADLIHEGRLLKAEQLCRKFLREQPHHIEAMRLLADIGVRLKVYDDAEFLLESCVEFAPDHIRARSDYLAILNRKARFAEAHEQARILVDAQPDNPAFQLSMATTLTGLAHFDEALAWYRRALATSPNRPAVHVMLGHALKAKGDVDGAVEAYREAYRGRPDYGDAYWSLANTKTYGFADAELEAMKRHEAAPGVAFDDRVHLCFAAGKALEDRGDYDASFEYYARGNALKYAKSGYDPAKTDEMIEAQIEHCTAELFERRGHLGCERPDPIFIVGLPRAGSTLLEQILASHPMIDGTHELHDILGLAQRLRGRTAKRAPEYPRNLAEIDASYFARFGEQYIERTRVHRGQAPLFIDKMPNNFMHVGLIRLILPNAKVIDARRHPMACCFSGFKQLFGEGQDFSYDLEALGRYYADYVRLMNHWDAVLPGFVLRVEHERVVADLESEVRRMLDFCGLPFEPACLEFHRTPRSVRTPSSEQVRRPIYTSGLDRWRSYSHHLDPLRDALGADVRARYPEDPPS